MKLFRGDEISFVRDELINYYNYYKLQYQSNQRKGKKDKATYIDTQM